MLQPWGAPPREGGSGAARGRMVGEGRGSLPPRLSYSRAGSGGGGSSSAGVSGRVLEDGGGEEFLYTAAFLVPAMLSAGLGGRGGGSVRCSAPAPGYQCVCGCWGTGTLYSSSPVLLPGLLWQKGQRASVFLSQLPPLRPALRGASLCISSLPSCLPYGGGALCASAPSPPALLTGGGGGGGVSVHQLSPLLPALLCSHLNGKQRKLPCLPWPPSSP
ncbi:unnamed protein product [Lepidochelys kempii]